MAATLRQTAAFTRAAFDSLLPRSGAAGGKLEAGAGASTGEGAAADQQRLEQLERQEQQQQAVQQEFAQPQPARMQQEQHVAIEMQGVHGSQQRLLSGNDSPPLLPSIRTGRSGGRHLSDSAPSPPELQLQQQNGSSPAQQQLSPPGSASSCRRRRGSGQAAVQPGPVGGSPLRSPGRQAGAERALERSASLSSELSVYAMQKGPSFKVGAGAAVPAQEPMKIRLCLYFIM